MILYKNKQTLKSDNQISDLSATKKSSLDNALLIFQAECITKHPSLNKYSLLYLFSATE